MALQLNNSMFAAHCCRQRGMSGASFKLRILFGSLDSRARANQRKPLSKVLKTGSMRHTDHLRVAKEQADLNACQTPADYAVAR
jgi:hypothetical protein